MDSSLKEKIIDIIDKTDDMTIATQRPDGFPQATTVSYVNDGTTIYFGTTDDAQKARNIDRDNKVSATINRPYSTWEDIVGLSLGGHAHRVTNKDEFDRIGALMMKKFPQIQNYEGFSDTPLSIFRVDPVVFSVLDYTQGFGHTETAKV